MSIDITWAELVREAQKLKENEASAPISIPVEEAPKHILIPTLFKETAERGIKRMESMENVIFPVSVSTAEGYDYSDRRLARKFTLKTESFSELGSMILGLRNSRLRYCASTRNLSGIVLN
ncbi:MAG: hypothetical protein ACHQ03_07795 [Candidatus Bathyarchaeia archaeon]